VTNNITEIEQETRDAISEKRRLTEVTSRINRDADLSDAAKARYLAEVRECAHRTHAEITEAHEKAITERLEQNERKLFRLRYPGNAPTPSQKETFRMGYRQCALALLGASEETVSRMMTRALRTGDSALAQAAYHESVERGLSEVGDEYRERYPQAAGAWDSYVRDRRAPESREHILAGALLKTQDA
jgi:hypothetical protein